jgi:hypothetical protein
MSVQEEIVDKHVPPSVSIIILNWNGWRDTIECLESLYRITYPDYNIIIADNGSENDSIEKIKEYLEGKLEVTSNFFKYSGKNKPIPFFEYSYDEFEEEVHNDRVIIDFPARKKFILIKNGKNYGFAEGNNIAIRYAIKALNPKYILLLNNDTVVDSFFLTELVNAAESDKNIGFVGPKTYYYDYHERADVINFAGGRLVIWKGKAIHIGVKEIDKGQYDKITDVDYIEGSCLLARREALDSVGLFDPKYFLYWEETDLCMRVKTNGFRLLYSPKAKIWHKGAGSLSGSTHMYYFIRNCFIFTKKYTTKLQYLSFLIWFLGYEFWYYSGISLLYHRDIKEWESLLKGILAGLQNHSGREI